MVRPMSLAIAPLLLGATASAQSINVDFGHASTPYGRPTPYYGASTGKAGVWNRVGTTSVSGLLRWDGQPTGASLVLNDDQPGCTNEAFPFLHLDVPATSGEAEALLDDRYAPEQLLAVCTFSGLEPGDYTVDTILSRTTCQHNIEVSVEGSPDAPIWVGGEWSGAFVEGGNYARHHKTVTDGTLQIRLQCGYIPDYVGLAGIQLDKGEQTYLGTRLCLGDGTGAPCPCANSGREGRGCQNSAGTGGAVLFAAGTTSPDTVVLRASETLPSALSIFLQGNASLTPVAYGDGLRCAGGTLRRLYTKSASDGEVFAPGPGDPSISDRSAQLGVPIPPDGRRYYQVYYRDANPTFCAAPQGNTFNATNAVKVDW